VVAAVELTSEAKRGRCGVTRNASENGLLVVTPSRFAEGDEVDLALHLSGHLQRRRARVVRVEENGRDSVEVWRYRLALELQSALPAADLEDAYARSRAL